MHFISIWAQHLHHSHIKLASTESSCFIFYPDVCLNLLFYRQKTNLTLCISHLEAHFSPYLFFKLLALCTILPLLPKKNYSRFLSALQLEHLSQRRHQSKFCQYVSLLFPFLSHVSPWFQNDCELSSVWKLCYLVFSNWANRTKQKLVLYRVFIVLFI